MRQSGGKGQYGHVVFKIEPNEPGKGFQFVDAIKGGVVPREYIPAVEKGVIEALTSGVLAGYPVVDVFWAEHVLPMMKSQQTVAQQTDIAQHIWVAWPGSQMAAKG